MKNHKKHIGNAILRYLTFSFTFIFVFCFMSLISPSDALSDYVYWDNGPMITEDGPNPGTDYYSQMVSSAFAYGYNHNNNQGARVADDFTVAVSNIEVTNIIFYAYQTYAGPPSTITAVYLQIWDGRPGDPGSSVIWGDLTTNRMISTTFTNIYRIFNSTPNTDRPIMSQTVEVNTTFTPGTYWLDWTVEGTASASGPWANPVQLVGQPTKPGANGRQYWSGSWGDIDDSGNLEIQDLPFLVMVSGTPVPTLTEWALIGFGGLLVIVGGWFIYRRII